MPTAKKPNSIFKPILGILLSVALLATACPITAQAADDNPSYNTLDIFPARDTDLDTMNVNNGTINILYPGGTVKVNNGSISSSRGSVYENFGAIDNLSSGHVGTNYGTIKRIDNTGSLGVNDTKGTILFIDMGNEVLRNDGTIQSNVGTISDNYGTITENYGAVIMHDGQIVNNHPNGTVTFETKISGDATIPARGTINNNTGRVKIYSGTVTVTENTGNIEINNATVTVENNSGNITVGNNATLICSNNKSNGVITKTDKSAKIVCNNDYGYTYDETADLYKIVFAGDDGKGIIIECDLTKDGVCYTQFRGAVVFTLPPEYECSSAEKLESGDVNTWVLSADPEEGDTEFTITCHRNSPCDLTGHTYGEWVITQEPTLTEPGSKERSCSVCKAVETEEIPVLTPTTYSIISGAGSEWTKGSTDGLVFICDAPFNKFVSVRIDAATIENTLYTAESGSTRITVSPSCLETLGTGKHSIEIVSADGTASADFTVIAAQSPDPTKPTDPTNPTDPTKPTAPTKPAKPANPARPASPQTGDNSPVLLWLFLLCISSGTFAATVIVGKKRKKAE